jgi:hypothetical protein
LARLAEGAALTGELALFSLAVARRRAIRPRDAASRRVGACPIDAAERTAIGRNLALGTVSAAR